MLGHSSLYSTYNIMKQQISSYTDTGKLLTHPYIPCTTEGCESKTTCFGQNLQSRITKAGSLEKLLTEFKCRQCRSGGVVTVKVLKKKKTKITKADTRAALVREMIHNAPKMNVSVRKPTPFLRDSPELVRSITLNGSCIRPDIFLDAGRKCDDCVYVENCQSSVKAFSKYYKA